MGPRARSRSNSNVPRVFDRWVDDEHEHLVLEYVAGTGLSELIQQGRAQAKPYFAPETALRMVIGLVKGLSVLHRNGICHGDLKPQNLVVVRNRLTMIDFGSAWSGGAPRGGRDRGTEGYAAPEQWLERRLVDARANQFSVCALLYQLCANELPWDGLGGAVVEHFEGRVPPPVPLSQHEIASRRELAWSKLDRVLEKGLAMNQDERFATTGAWLRALEQVIEPHAEDATKGLSAIAVRELFARVLRRFRSTKATSR